MSKRRRNKKTGVRVDSLVRQLVVLMVLVLAAAGLFAFGTDRGWWRFNYPTPARFPIFGLDVSHHQGHIDWSTVAKSPRIKFAYIKATEGADFTDPRFEENWTGAQSAGLKTGAYHFFSFCTPPIDQAKLFVATVPHDPAALPPVLDVELGGSCSAHPQPAAVRQAIAAWMQTVSHDLHRRPLIYVTHETYEAFIQGSSLETYGIWIRDIWWEPKLRTPWALWQFACREHVPGIDAFVDLNTFPGELGPLFQLTATDAPGM